MGAGDERDLQNLAPTVELGIPNGAHFAGLIRLSLWCREELESCLIVSRSFEGTGWCFVCFSSCEKVSLNDLVNEKRRKKRCSPGSFI
jgi:hypothetical protein